MGTRAYLDNHTAARPSSRSVDAQSRFFHESWGAVTAPHQMGQDSYFALAKNVDEIVQELGGAKGDQFYFCHSGAEAVNAVFFSHYIEEVRESGRNHILTTNIEDAPALLSLKRLEKFHCVEKILPVNAQGQITKEMVEEAIKPRTSLLSLSWANSLTGVVHPVADIAEICRQKGIRLHVDASTAIGKLFFHFEDINIDYLTFDGSLIHAPKGTGGVIVKEGISFHPLVAGGANLHVGGFAAIAAALSEASRNFDHLNLETARLRDMLETGIKRGFSDAEVLFKEVERLPNCTVIAFPGVESDALLYLLNRKGVYASMGGGQTQKLFHTLTACGTDPMLAHCALSFSLSYETTEEEIAFAIQTIVESAAKLQRCSAGVFGENA
jgi:cysteine desulfurase